MDDYVLVLLPEAFDDLDAIGDFYQENVGPISAQKITDKLLDAMEMLSSFPHLGPLHSDPELAEKDYRKLVLNQTYVAVYKVMDRQVVVYRVVNGASDYPQLLR